MSLTERIRKYCRNFVASAVFAAGVLGSAYSGEVAYKNLSPENTKNQECIIEQLNGQQESGLQEYKEFVNGAFDKKYDNHNAFCKDSLEGLLETSHKIYGNITVEVTKYDYSEPKVKKEVFEHTLTGIGSCVAIKNDGKYLTLVTANHVVNPPAIPDKYDSQGRPLATFKIKEINYILEQEDLFVPLIAVPFIGTERMSVGPELEVIARDAEHDIAIVRTKKEFREQIEDCKAFKSWGNSKELEPGDFLYSVGFPANITKQLVSGHVSAKGNPYTREDDHLFVADAAINKGLSGGPVYALRDGKPELVGIVHSKWPEGIGGIIRIEFVKNLLKKIGLGKLVGDAR